MVIMSASGAGKSFGTHTVLKNITFNVQTGEKIGILGANGAGKTTLFSLIAREAEPDEGSINISKNTRIAYMRQHADYTSEKTAYEDVLEAFSALIQKEHAIEIAKAELETGSAAAIERYTRLEREFADEGGLTYASRAKSTLIGLGLSEDQINLPMSSLSGGQRTLVLLAKLLLTESDILLLDEPTNHLDIKATAWLEEFLKEYRGAVMVISHDRYFLDKVTDAIFDIEHGTLKRYNGNYSKYVREKEVFKLAEQREYEKKKKEIERLEGIIAQQKQWNREKNIVTARSKQKAIDRIEATMVRPEKELEGIRFKFHAAKVPGNDVLVAEGVKKSYGDRVLFEDANMHIRRGEKVFLIGDNGTGKTTLINIFTDKAQADCGRFELGSRVEVGLYEQVQSDVLTGDNVLSVLSDSIPRPEGELRSALAALGFRGEDVYKEVSKLSGGERARIALCRLMLSKNNFLILDEPTNHLDIQSKEMLEEALLGYDGTLLMISHDRYFIDKLAEKIYAIENGKLNAYAGGYSYYLAHAEETPKAAAPAPKKNTNNEYAQRKAKSQEASRLRGAISRAEQKIANLEERSAEIEAEMASPAVASDFEKAMELSNEMEKLQQELEAVYAEWEELTERIEELK